jgi:hypothetical protein
MKKLRLDLLRVLLYAREQTIHELERDLRSTQDAADSVALQEKAHSIDIAEIDERLGLVTDPQERAEMEKARMQLISSGQRRIESGKHAWAARQSELNSLLKAARQARDYLASVAAGLERELTPR